VKGEIADFSVFLHSVIGRTNISSPLQL